MQMTFGEIIRDAREKSSLSQEDVAKAIEKKYHIRLSPSYLSMIENGSRTNLTVNLLGALLDFFGLPLETALSLFAQPALKSSYLFEASKTYGGFSGEGQAGGALDGLPEEARRSLADYTEYIIEKYKRSQESSGKNR